MRYSMSPGSGGSSFDGTAALRAREGLGMGPADVAYGMHAAYGLDIEPATVVAWEHGELTPDERQLTALAGALWCSAGDLLGEPRTLREFRLARSLSAADVAMEAGMDAAVYARVEETGVWTGDARQAEALAGVLRLPVPAFVELTGRGEELAGLLRRAVTSRWQAYSGPVTRIVPLPRPYVEDGLRALQEAYASVTTASLGWGQASSAGARDASRDFMADILDHFWDAMET
ncbi:helix-turn-helix transcriptional regulator [Streptomyces iconiensis]|uniref:Helix-turn-helix transcriptional regulator n=1 Tax=Streptomyces iconiensis TaxID=1384038 RepID=A0ABT6ZVL3_9ACTN|nr:helix-turn-helix transcriptional regulator [Streptomyces iconiensis]MDJ1132867.1 helix-turn-helix transcriptional regulator [Streptomyces iconiensis]